MSERISVSQLEELVFRGIESDELDYKAHQDWNALTRAGRGKIVRHLLALANTKGGYIVIGVGEDNSGRPALYTGVSEAESDSFDPTPVGSFINRCAEPPIDFTIERPVIRGKRYVIFIVRPFSDLPHVCCNSVETELQTGVFYIRTPEASSRPACRALEMQQLIQRALRNQREQLGRILRGILYESHIAQEQDGSGIFADTIRSAEEFFSRRRKSRGGIVLEFALIPNHFSPEQFSLSDLRRIAGESWIYHPGSSLIGDGEVRETYFTNTSLRYLKENPPEKMWQLFKSGLLHSITVLEAEKELSLEFFSRWSREAMEFAGRLFSSFGWNEELITVHCKLDNVENCRLLFEDKEAGVCRIAKAEVIFQRSAADLAVGVSAHSVRLLRGIAERFNTSDELLARIEGGTLL